MKQIKNLSWILLSLMVFGLASCRKDNPTGSFEPGKGAPTITSVHTFSKTDTTAQTRTISVIGANGATTTTTVGAPSLVTPFDSVTTTGNKGQMYIVYGSNLGSTTKISFNGVSAYFNRALVTDQSVIVSIPNNVPTVGTAATGKLVISTVNGSATYNFTVLPPKPTISGVSDFNFSANSQLTLLGQGFAAVTAVTLTNGGAAATIVSKNDSVLVLKMPAASVSRTLLSFAYTSAASVGKTLNTNSTLEFVDMDNNYQVFANGAFANGWTDNSWAHPSGPDAAAPSISGKGSIVAQYPKGGWQIEGWADWNENGGQGIAYDPAYKYLTFWVKGGTVNHTLVLVGDQMKGGYGQVQNANAYTAQLITVPKNVWTYFKIPLGARTSTDPKQLNFWANGAYAKQLGFFLMGQSGDVDETYYFDEVMFVK